MISREEIGSMSINEIWELIQDYEHKLTCAKIDLCHAQEKADAKWISVKERLPEKPGHYLVLTCINYWHGGCLDKNADWFGTTKGYENTTMSVLDSFYDITGDWNMCCNDHITHWMPLPEPPKED